MIAFVSINFIMQDTILTAFLLLQVKFGRNIKAQFINYLKSEVCHKELGANFSKIKTIPHHAMQNTLRSRSSFSNNGYLFTLGIESLNKYFPLNQI